jgi:hypothetical protein
VAETMIKAKKKVMMVCLVAFLSMGFWAGFVGAGEEGITPFG